jgi:hypothetical protein
MPRLFLASLVVGLWLCACQFLPGAAPTPARQISYDGPVTLTIKAGETLPGTTVAYHGKAPDGRAILSINGVQAVKATADSVNWTGALVLFSLIDLKLRIVTFDDAGMTLAGTIRIVVQEPAPAAGNPSANRAADYVIPVSYTVERGGVIPGTNVAYVGARTGGAEFTNLDQYPFRERFDSVVWQGHLRERIALRLDLRVLDFNADRVVLGGTAQIIFEK